MASTIYDFSVTKQDGSIQSLKDFEGKALLVVNTATGCGFTPQYEDLEALYKKYRDKGFEILDFPCNQFLEQAPGTDEEIHQFCTLKFGTEFPQFKKIDVNGDSADPLFVWLCSEKPHISLADKTHTKEEKEQVAFMEPYVEKEVDAKFGDGARIKWNFTKFLIDRKGQVVDRFEPTSSLDDLRDAVAKLVG